MLYDIGFLVFSLFYLPALIFKGKLHGDFLERFGRFGPDKKKALEAGSGRIWIQAVSVGEVSLCRSLIPDLIKRFPGKEIVLSTITKTGNDLARKLFSDHAIIIYFPLDLSAVVRKAVTVVKPSLYIMIETEIWPNLLGELCRRDIRTILINGRISDRSFAKYKMIKGFLRKTMEKIDLFCMQSDKDMKKIISLGAPIDRVRVTGTMKFDTEPGSAAGPDNAGRGELGLKNGDELLVAGSTHKGEEEIILSIYSRLLRDYPYVKLLLAPRHIVRVKEIDAIVRQHSFDPVRVSQISNPGRPCNHGSRPKVLILDTIGHLKDIYSIASLVFIGGSLVDRGGQNPIEAGVHERSVLFGPYMSNFGTVADLLIAGEGAIRIASGDDLLEKLKMLLNDVSARSRLGRNARKIIMENRGATDKNINMIEGLL